MAYATRSDLEERYGADEVAQRESVLGVGSVDRSLADADGEIDSYVASRYTVPLAPVPANVPRLAAAIARYHLLGEAASDIARKDYEDAIRWLRDIQSGKARLDAAAPVAAASVPVSVELVSRPKIFNGGLR